MEHGDICNIAVGKHVPLVQDKKQVKKENMMRDKSGKFVRGHKFNLGRRHTEETKKNMSRAKMGHSVSKEARLKMSLANRGKKGWSKRLTKETDERVRKNANNLVGHKFSDETRQKISETLKKRVASGQWTNPMETIDARKKISEKLKGRKCPWNKNNRFKKGHVSWSKGKKMSEEFCRKNRELILKHYREHPETIEKIKIARSKQIMPKYDTIPEQIVQANLFQNGIMFRTHESILGQPDIFIEPNLCIFVDGCYWHGCEQCHNKNKMSEWIRSRIVRDQLITQKLILDGYKVLRFWEHDIKKDIDYVMFQIKNTIETKEVKVL